MNLQSHLESRWCNSKLYSGVYLSEEWATFYLWNLTGQLVGYQTYNPSKDKSHRPDNPKEARYYTKTSSNQLAIWGLETIKYDQPLFITEGIFDACRLHYHNLPAIAVLGNNPKHLCNWLSILPLPTIAVVQGDVAGKKLAKFANSVIFLPTNQDVGSLTEHQFKEIFL